MVSMLCFLLHVQAPEKPTFGASTLTDWVIEPLAAANSFPMLGYGTT